MEITSESTVQKILEARPDAINVFLKHGVDVPCECDESIQDCSLEICESMCHIDDLPALIGDLQAFFDDRDWQ
ncbi:MAG: hypothetical protein K2X29_12665 [Candidatus Obscuribacterales bacterium]|nr:hypothetical protein [Candidatus Obscuribacterales bacterium]